MMYRIGRRSLAFAVTNSFGMPAITTMLRCAKALDRFLPALSALRLAHLLAASLRRTSPRSEPPLVPLPAPVAPLLQTESWIMTAVTQVGHLLQRIEGAVAATNVYHRRPSQHEG